MAAKKKNTTKAAREYVIVRCRDAGVHVGYLKSITRRHITLSRSRRIHCWNGAASLSELAVYGLNEAKSHGTRIAVELPTIRLRTDDHCEIIAMQPDAARQIQEWPPWRA